MSKERKKHKLNIKRFLIVCGVLLAFVFVLVEGVKLTNLEIQKKAAEAKLQELADKQEQLEAELEEVDSPEYIEQEARSELHMIKKFELLYVIQGKKDDK